MIRAEHVVAGMTVSLRAPLDPDHWNANLGMVVRAERARGGDGALVTRSFADTAAGWAPTWVPLGQLFAVDDATYQAWSVNRVHSRALRGRLPAASSTSTWEQRHAARQLDRAHHLAATHRALHERWRAVGLIADRDEHLDSDGNLVLFDLPSAA